MAKVQQAQKVHYNCCYTTVEYQVRDTVFLSTRHLPTVGLRKLMPCFVVLFCISWKIGEQAYKVWLTLTMVQIHPIFYVSQLRLSPMDTGKQPGPVLIDGE